jgi:hypothetical protein
LIIGDLWSGEGRYQADQEHGWQAVPKGKKMACSDSIKRLIGMLPVNKITCGDALRVLKTFPSASIDMVMTSPPYSM